MGQTAEIIIGLIIASGMTLGLFGYYSGLAVSYNAPIGNFTNSSAYVFATKTNSSIITKLDSLQNKTLELGQKAQAGSLLEAIIIGANLLVDTGSILVEFPKIIIDFMTGAQRLSGIFIPNWFIATLSVAIIATFLFKVLDLAFKRDV